MHEPENALGSYLEKRGEASHAIARCSRQPCRPRALGGAHDRTGRRLTDPRRRGRRHGPDRGRRRRGRETAVRAGPAGLRPERADLRSEHADEPDSGGGRRDRQPAGAQPVRIAALRPAVQARHLRHGRRAPQLPGRLLHQRGGPRPLAERRRHQRFRLRPQPVRRHGCCIGAQQLLALAVEPDDQREHPGLRLLQRRVLGGVAGRADAPGPRQRPHHPDGLLHRPVVCERRLHRRFGVRGQHRDQRLAAAVARQEQRARRLDERRLEPGVLGRRRTRPPSASPLRRRAAARTRRSRPAR